MDRFQVSTFRGKMQLSIHDVKRPSGLSAQARVSSCLEKLSTDVATQHDYTITSRLVPLDFDVQWEKIVWALDCMIQILQEESDAFERPQAGSRIAMAPEIGGSSYRVVVQLLVDVTAQRCVDGPNLLHQRCCQLLREYLARYAFPDIFGAPLEAKGTNVAAAAGATPCTVAEDDGEGFCAPAAPPPLTESMFSKLVGWWRRHKIFSELIRQLFGSVDRNAVSGHPRKWSVSAEAACAWQDIIFRQVEIQCRQRLLRTLASNRVTEVLRSEEPIDELAEMFKVAALVSSCVRRSQSSTGGTEGVLAKHDTDTEMSRALRSSTSDPALHEVGFHQIEYLVDPGVALRRHRFVVPDQLPVLRIRGVHTLKAPLGSPAMTEVQRRIDRPVLKIARLTGDPRRTSYSSMIEQHFLQETRAYFVAKTAEWLGTEHMPFDRFAQIFTDALEVETSRAQLYLMDHTARRVRDVMLEVALLAPQSKGLICTAEDLDIAFQAAQEFYTQNRHSHGPGFSSSGLGASVTTAGSRLGSEKRTTLGLAYSLLRELQAGLTAGRIRQIQSPGMDVTDAARVAFERRTRQACAATQQAWRARLQSMEREIQLAAEERIAAHCPAGHTMACSHFAGASYSNGWVCDICNVTAAAGTGRWFCMECGADTCFECHPRSPEDGRSAGEAHLHRQELEDARRSQEQRLRMRANHSLGAATKTLAFATIEETTVTKPSVGISSPEACRGREPELGVGFGTERKQLPQAPGTLLAAFPVGLAPLRSHFHEYCLAVIKDRVSMYAFRRDSSSGLNKCTLSELTPPPRQRRRTRSRTESMDTTTSSSSLQHRIVMRCSLVTSILEATSDLVPLVVTMGGDSSMQRELDRAVARVINTTSFKREIGGSFGVALATFSDQLLRGRSYRSGQEVLLTAEQDRNELLPKACYLAHAVKDKDILRTHLEHAAMERYLSSERHLTLLPGCEVRFLQLISAAVSTVFAQALRTMYHDIYSEPARAAAQKFAKFLANPPPPLTAAEEATLRQLKAVAVNARSPSSDTSSPVAAACPKPASTPSSANERGAGEEARESSPSVQRRSPQSRPSVANTHTRSPRSGGRDSNGRRVADEPLQLTPQQQSVLSSIEAAFLRAEDEHARAVTQQQLSARARLRRRLSEKQRERSKSRSPRSNDEGSTGQNGGRGEMGGNESRTHRPVGDDQAESAGESGAISSTTDDASDGTKQLHEEEAIGQSATPVSQPKLVRQASVSYAAPCYGPPLSLDSAPSMPAGFTTNASISASIMSSVWPSIEVASPRRLPPVLQYCYERFLEFSRRQTLQGTHGSQRVIKFHWAQTRVVVSGKFPRVNEKFKMCEFHVNALQAVVLSVFTKNRKAGITFSDIAAAFGFNFDPSAGFELESEAAVVFAALDSLLDATKYPSTVTGGAVIMRSSSPYTGLTPSLMMASSLTASPSLSPLGVPVGSGRSATLLSGFPLQLTDTFKLNRNFSSKIQKIVLEEPLALAQFQELMVTAAVKRIRALTVRSAVMRVMKQRRECAHKELAAELPACVTQFKVTSRALRVALTHLIDLHYIRRDDQNPERYIYCEGDGLGTPQKYPQTPAEAIPLLDGGSAATATPSGSGSCTSDTESAPGTPWSFGDGSQPRSSGRSLGGLTSQGSETTTPSRQLARALSPGSSTSTRSNPRT